MSSIKLSIVIPVYNVEEYLKQCLESLVSQTLDSDKYEIILINDGSTDRSLEICKEYVNRHSNIRLHSQSNMGQATARNYGIDHAIGEYIAFVDSDDYVDFSMFEDLLNIMEQNEIDFVQGGFDRVSQSGEPMPKVYNPESYAGINQVMNKNALLLAYAEEYIYPMTWGKIYKRDLFDKNGIRFPEGVKFEDFMFSLQTMRFAETGIIIEKSYYRYRTRIGSTAGNKSVNALNDFINQISNSLKFMDTISEEQLPKRYKEIYRDIRKKRLIDKFLDYQLLMFTGMVYSENIDQEQTYYLFGASLQAERYLTLIEKEKYKPNIILIDNSTIKQREGYRGYQVLSPEQFAKTRVPNSKLIITSVYLDEISQQLKDLGVIQSSRDFMINNGQTTIEQIFIRGLEELASKI